MTPTLQDQDASLRGLRVLLHRKNSMRSIFEPLLELAKERWGWQVDVFCDDGDGSEYRNLVGSEGRIYVMPDVEKEFAWESDPTAVADVDERLRLAELAARTSINRLPLSNERNLGAGYVAPHWNVTDNPLAVEMLKKNTEPFRIARRYFQYADQMLVERAPDFILTFEWGKPYRFASWLAAAGRGIPCIALRRSKVLSDRSYYTTDPLLFNSRAIKAATERGKTSIVSEEARDYLNKFREQPATVQYISDRWALAHRKKQLAWYTWLAKNAGMDVARVMLGRQGRRQSAFRRLVKYNRETLAARRQEKFFRQFNDTQLAEMKYVYFPLHKETDISQTFQAAVWHDQRNTIQVLASSIPGNYRLLVREHRFNRGLRPDRYYRELLQLPNVILIDALESQFKYLNNADLVVTENGSSGWEGILMGRRVITLAPCFYDGAGLATKVRDVNTLGATIVEILNCPAVKIQDEYDKHLAMVLDAERETTISPNDGPAVALNALQVVLQEIPAARKH